MRRLAEELGVTPMSLYRYVESKDELLDVVVDALLEATRLPDELDNDWVAWLRESARRLRALLVASPVARDVFTRRPVTTPAALRRMEASLRVLTGDGFSAEAALRAYAAVHVYTIGFAALETARGCVPDVV